MSFTELKPVCFDYGEPYQPAQSHPPYFHPYDTYQPQHQIVQNGNGTAHANGNGVVHHNGNVHHHNGNGVHHHHHPHIQHQPYRQPPSQQASHIQHLHYMGDSQDSDSQDSMDSVYRTNPQKRYHPPASKAPTVYTNDSDEELSEEVRNHWMPMTWCERSSDDPQVFNFVCLWGQCVTQSASKQEFEEHLFTHVPSVEETIQNSIYAQSETVRCEVRGCNKECQSLFELSRHVSMHVFQADCQQKGAEALIEKEEYVGIESCGFDPCTNIEYEGMVVICLWMDCGKQFNSLTDLFDHVSGHVDKIGDIDRVEQEFTNGGRKVVYQCKWTGCKQVAESKAHLRRHTRHHSGEKALACPFCARFFSRRDKLYDHCVRRTILMTDPDIEDPYVCKLCQKRFGTERALCMHVTRHLVGSTCPLCSLGLGCRAAVHRHLMTKHSRRTKDFKCTTCQKLFFTESELNRHAIYHTDVMYSCKHCPDKFKWKKQLLKHMKEHEENFNPSPYTCHICERAYTTGFALGRHLTKQHRLQVPYGFSRFTYKKCEDGLMRLQTKKFFRRGVAGEQPKEDVVNSPY